MGIFSWLFSKNTENSSWIRKWLRQEIGKVDQANPDIYAIFVTILHAASRCGKYSAEEENNPFGKVAKQYLGDATIFEIACYTYFHLENWLLKNKPEYKDDIALPVRKRIVGKFSLIFSVDEQQLSQVLMENLNRYQTITGAGQEVTDMHIELAQRVAMTKGNQFNSKQLPKDSSNTTVDFQYIKDSIEKYEEECIPTVIAVLQAYCIAHPKKTADQVATHEHNQEEKDYLYGMVLVGQKDWVRACNAFTKVLTANPHHYEALVQRGLLYINLYQSVDALRDFTKAIEIKPKEPAAYLYRATCYHRSVRQPDKSLADYKMAIGLAPEVATGYFGRGELYDDMALRDEKQALEQEDQDSYAQISEEFLAAIQDYNQVIALESKHDEAYVKRALLYARKARATKNIEFAKQAIADFEQAMSLNWEHGYLYKQQDEMKELVDGEIS